MEKDKIEIWIENNRKKYLLILAGLGYVLGYLFFYLVGNSHWVGMGFKIGSLIAVLFVIADLMIHKDLRG